MRVEDCAGRRLLQNPISGALPAGFKPPPLTCKRGGQYPYMVSVRDRIGNHHCGGVVIDSIAVLTAAHCVDPRVSSGSSPRPLLYIGGLDNGSPVEVSCRAPLIGVENFFENGGFISLCFSTSRISSYRGIKRQL